MLIGTVTVSDGSSAGDRIGVGEGVRFREYIEDFGETMDL